MCESIHDTFKLQSKRGKKLFPSLSNFLNPFLTSFYLALSFVLLQYSLFFASVYSIFFFRGLYVAGKEKIEITWDLPWLSFRFPCLFITLLFHLFMINYELYNKRFYKKKIFFFYHFPLLHFILHLVIHASRFSL